MDSMEHTFVLPVGKQWLIYAPLHDVAALVNLAAVEQLNDAGDCNKSSEIDQLRSILNQEHVSVPPQQNRDLSPEFLGLITTRACNLSCVYCAFGAHREPQKKMSFDTAVTAVDWMASHTQRIGSHTLNIHFFGGEPMAASEVVEVAVHRARAVANQLRLVPKFEIATNGVATGHSVQFLGDYFDTVVLSFDGPESIHDYHRPISKSRGSFAEVARTAHQLSESPVELNIRACVTRTTVSQLEEITEWFCKRFQPSAITFETLQLTPQAMAAQLEPPSPFDFAVHYLCAERVAAFYGVQCIYAASLIDKPRSSFCPVGNDTLIVSPDGRVSGCYLSESEWQAQGLDLNLGWLTECGELFLDGQAIDRLRRLVAKKPRCERCFCRWSCAGGCHVNHGGQASCADYDDFCQQTRLITACHLVSELDEKARVDSMLGDREAMKRLASQPSDLLCDWERLK